MSDDETIPFYSPHQPPAPPRQPQPGALLFEFAKDADRYRVELRDDGEYGVEAQVFTNGDLWQACRFLDRAWATQWAERVRGGVARTARVAVSIHCRADEMATGAVAQRYGVGPDSSAH